MAVEARSLDQLVTFRRQVATSDDMGGNATSWVDIATVWASVRPMTGREREHADRVNAQSNYMMTIRSRTDINESDIVVWGGAQFNIRFIKYQARSRFLEIEAEKGVAT